MSHILVADSNTPFAGFDFAYFWNNDPYYKAKEAPAPTEAAIAAAEDKLGYRLPDSYKYLVTQVKNGGAPVKTYHLKGDYVCQVAYIYGVHDDGLPKWQANWLDEWGYPDRGIYFADCPSGGHDMLLLDYQDCGKNGEPKVCHVDQEGNFEVTFVANTFEAFVRGLVDEQAVEHLL